MSKGVGKGGLLFNIVDIFPFVANPLSVPPPVTISPSGRREPAGAARVTAWDPVVSALPARHSHAGLPGGCWGWGLSQPPPPTHGPTGAGPQPTRSVHSVIEKSTSTHLFH